MVHDSPSSARSGADISWTEIEDLLDYLAQRASEAVPPDEFFRELLNQAVPALAAVAGAVWTFNPQGQLELVHQVNLPATEIGASEDALEAHEELLRRAVKESKAFSVPPGSGSDKSQRNGQAENPTDYLILFAPIRSDEDVAGILEIFQRPAHDPRRAARIFAVFGNLERNRRRFHQKARIAEPPRPFGALGAIPSLRGAGAFRFGFGPHRVCPGERWAGSHRLRPGERFARQRAKELPPEIHERPGHHRPPGQSGEAFGAALHRRRRNGRTFVVSRRRRRLAAANRSPAPALSR